MQEEFDEISKRMKLFKTVHLDPSNFLTRSDQKPNRLLKKASISVHICMV